MPKIFIVNVGVNTSHGNLKSPIFEDGTFIYTPIPERNELQKLRGLLSYSDILTSKEIQFIPEKYVQIKAHYDPEFLTFTYGDYPVQKPRVANLKYVDKGDYIFFLARLVTWKNGKFTDNAGFYLIGHFKIDSILKDIKNISKYDDYNDVKNNAHMIRTIRAGNPPDGFWVFKGNSKSKLFKHAVPFNREFTNRVMKDRYGKSWKWDRKRSELQIIGSYTRSCRVITDKKRITYFWEHIGNYDKI